MRLLAILITLVSQPFAGITYIDRTETSPRAVHMHRQVDLSAPGLRFLLRRPRVAAKSSGRPRSTI
jgi:hypothetical protein